MVHFCNHVYLAQTWEVQGMRRWLQEHHVPEEQAAQSQGSAQRGWNMDGSTGQGVSLLDMAFPGWLLAVV